MSRPAEQRHLTSGRASPILGVREVALAAFGGLALALAMTWPLASGLSSTIAKYLFDPLLQTWHVTWMSRACARSAAASCSTSTGRLEPSWEPRENRSVAGGLSLSREVVGRVVLYRPELPASTGRGSPCGLIRADPVDGTSTIVPCPSCT